MKIVKVDAQRYMTACDVYNDLISEHGGDCSFPVFMQFTDAPLGFMVSTAKILVSERGARRIAWLLGPYAATMFKAWLTQRSAPQQEVIEKKFIRYERGSSNNDKAT